jgi:hypothetical protein
VGRNEAGQVEDKYSYWFHTLANRRVKASRLSRDLIFGFINVQPHFWLFLALYGSLWLLWLFMASYGSRQ